MIMNVLVVSDFLYSITINNAYNSAMRTFG